MEEEDIVKLIAQDLRHNMLLLKLEKVGLKTEYYDLDIISLVAKGMGIKNGKYSDRFAETYTTCLYKSIELEPNYKIEGLHDLARKTYKDLKQVEQ